MKQKIFLENFETLASIGVYEHEKVDKQKIIINLKITLRNNEKSLNDIMDRLENVYDYGLFRKTILNVIDIKHYDLLETLCNDIIHDIMTSHGHVVEKVKIKITKPEAFKDCNVSIAFSDP